VQSRHRPLIGLPSRAAALAHALGVLGLLLAPRGAMPAPTALGASTDLSVVTATRYTVQPDQKRIRVAVDVTIANHRADTRTSRYYYDHAFLAVQPGAASPSVVKGPKRASVRVASRAADQTVLRLDFGAKLYGGHTTSFRFAFNLADVGSGARRLIRVGTSLITFPVWAYASDGATGSRVTVRFPKGYDVTVESGAFGTQAHTSDGGTILSTGTLANPLGFFAYVSAQQPATYRTTSMAVKVPDGTIPLSMKAWKDDKSWAGRVGGLFGRALPVLQADIGMAWPHDGPVVVQEAVSRSTGGYAGLYDPKASQIQVAYWAGSAVIVHEAAHGWFNGSLLADRWADEGFASLYAQRALRTLAIKASVPKLTAKLRAAAFPLNAWPASPAPASASEAYGYAGSYALAALIAKRAGPEALARVWADAAGRIGVYQPPAGQGTGAAETVDGAPDWRGLLDLLETETGQDFTDLWRTWVVRPDEAALLDRRAAAQAAYTTLLGSTGGWALPRSVRDALRAWQFDSATSLLSKARQALAERASLETAAKDAGLSLPARMQTLFEAGDFTGAVAEAQAERAAIAAITGATAAGTSGDDPVTAVGLIGGDPERDLGAARTAFAAGDNAGAVTVANAASQAWAGAYGEGRRRLLMGISLAAALAVLGLSLVSRLRHSRTTPPGSPRHEAPALLGGTAIVIARPRGRHGAQATTSPGDPSTVVQAAPPAAPEPYPILPANATAGEPPEPPSDIVDEGAQ
jgi:hypothetical protein